MKTLRIVIEPVRMRQTGMIYAVRLDGRLLCEHLEPFFTAARILIAEGHDPASRLEMSRLGRDQVDLFATLGVAAGLTVREQSERGPEIIRHVPDRGAKPDRPPSKNAPTTSRLQELPPLGAT